MKLAPLSIFTAFVLLFASPLFPSQLASEPPSEPAASASEQRVAALLTTQGEQGELLYTLARLAHDAGRVTACLGYLERLERGGWRGGIERADFVDLADDLRFLRVASRLEGREERIGHAEEVVSFFAPNLGPEGTAWDAKRRELFLSSIGKRQVVAVDREGKVSELTAPAAEGLLAVLGLEVDAARDLLWVATVADREMVGYRPEDDGRSELVAIGLGGSHLRSPPRGAIVRRAAAPQGTFLNDLVVSADGTVYATDSKGSQVFRLGLGEAQLERLALPEGTLRSPNGLALADDDKALYVADFLGLVRIELATGQAERLVTPSGLGSLGGIDGLDFFRFRGSPGFVAVQNAAGRGRVVTITLDGSGRKIQSAEVLEAGHPRFAIPTTGAVVEGANGFEYWFLANPQAVHRPAERGGLPYTLLRLPLPK